MRRLKPTVLGSFLFCILYIFLLIGCFYLLQYVDFPKGLGHGIDALYVIIGLHAALLFADLFFCHLIPNLMLGMLTLVAESAGGRARGILFADAEKEFQKEIDGIRENTKDNPTIW